MKEAIITNIQHFSVGDGPGIRTTIFLKGCNLHCPWCHNPETISANIDSLYGKRYSIDAVIAEIMEDEAFYRESGGGVTLSGGEPLLQADACAKIAAACKNKGLHVLLDTAGNVDFGLFEKVLPNIDMCYFDLKSGIEDGYIAIGGELKRTLQNIKAVNAYGVYVVVRIPVIPGFNDDIKAAQQMAEALSQTSVAKVSLLPFHRLGSSKYTALGMDYKYKNIPSMTTKEIEPLFTVFREKGFDVTIGG